MRITQSLTDEALLTELGERISRHRLNLNVKQSELAREAGLSKRTVERIEAGASTQLTNLIRVLRALDLLDNLELLVPEPTPSPLEQLKLRGKERTRASGASEAPAEGDVWKWGDES